MAITRSRKRGCDFDPPEEYRSQQTQDEEEWDGNIGCSKGPRHEPSRPYSLEDELQYLIWDAGIRCEAFLVKKTDSAGNEYPSARLDGPLSEKLLAKPLAQKWINALFEKKCGRAA